LRNAKIISVDLDIERNLTMWLMLDYGDLMQRFGGYALGRDNAGYFITRVLQVAGVERMSDLTGCSVRAIGTHEAVMKIGHFLKDDWFHPSVDMNRTVTAK